MIRDHLESFPDILSVILLKEYDKQLNSSTTETNRILDLKTPGNI